MMDLEEYRKKLNQDPKARRTLRKLEKEYEKVTSELTPEEAAKYGFAGGADEAPSPGGEHGTEHDAKAEQKASGVIDLIGRSGGGK